MALMLLQKGEVEAEDEEPDYMLDLEEVLDVVPEFDVKGINPIIMDGEDFLFLDDICKALPLREDEALKIIANQNGMPSEGETSQPSIVIDF